jgi:iron only hydrogenase large subunit-like protein
MEQLNPIYTEKTECQDCYKCVRNCPVKAINVKDHSASVDQTKCITCGQCVNVCPNNAKRVRNDIKIMQTLLSENEIVIASLAPSVISEFKHLSIAKIIGFLKYLGFHGVSETALGAEEVSRQVAEYIAKSDQQVMISSACPVVVHYIQQYLPQYVSNITPFYSPILTHCMMLKKIYGPKAKIVFFGPCIAKKNEADQNPELLDLVLTFNDLRALIEENKIQFSSLIPSQDDVFIPQRSYEGSLYPVDGGMISGIKLYRDLAQTHFLSKSGLDSVKAALEGLNDFNPENREEKIFLEFLACPGGCINGPLTHIKTNTVNKQIYVEKYSRIREKNDIQNQGFNSSNAEVEIHTVYPLLEDKIPQFSEKEIKKALEVSGKYHLKDELNCGGCGYDTCRNFAIALLQNRAEPAMCVSYMRKLALNKANALITAMPAGVAIIDENLLILECNYRFIKLICPEVIQAFDGISSMKGLCLRKAISFPTLFERVLHDDSQVIDTEIKHNNSILKINIFSIEKNKILGAIVQDVTEPAVQRDQIVNKAQEVIKKTLNTAQKIAYLLGENAAESEIILSDIIGSYSTSEKKEKKR